MLTRAHVIRGDSHDSPVVPRRVDRYKNTTKYSATRARPARYNSSQSVRLLGKDFGRIGRPYLLYLYLFARARLFARRSYERYNERSSSRASDRCRVTGGVRKDFTHFLIPREERSDRAFGLSNVILPHMRVRARARAYTHFPLNRRALVGGPARARARESERTGWP